jgi:hypothetical protein
MHSRGNARQRLEAIGLVIALGVLGVFAGTVGVAFVSRPAAFEVSDDGPGDPQTTYQAGEAIFAWHDGRWYPAHVHSTTAERYFVTYDDFSISWHEWVTARRLRPR